MTRIAFALGTLVTLAAACGGPSDSGPADAAGEPGQFGASTLRGRVTFEGAAPAPARIRMDSDPLCQADGATSDTLLVGADGGLRNAFVYVKEGASGSYAAPGDPVMLDQVGCRYIPHVFGVQTGQPLHITNSDPAVHNVNAVARANDGFNLIQQPDGPSSTRRFDTPEVMVPIRCDVHPWMNAWAGVVAHPFFAVSGEDGTFEIGRLPAGTYTIEAWHEQLKTQTQTITVDGLSDAEVTFTFAAGA